MTMFLTKVWGFREPVGPLQFSTEGWRRRARSDLKPGDTVVLVGTKAPPTIEPERGRLLGIMEPTPEPVRCLDFDLPTRAEDFDESNNYRWPFGLLNRRAWKLIDRPELDDISDRRFNMDAALGLVELTEAEARVVADLHRVDAELLVPTVRARARVGGDEVQARRKSAPPPSTQRQGVMHLRRAPAYTYALQLMGASESAFKIGWAFDFKLRMRQFNQAAMPQLGGLHYKAEFTHLWDTARQAFAMEQALLRQLDFRRHPSNREVIVGLNAKELQKIWTAQFTG